MPLNWSTRSIKFLRRKGGKPSAKQTNFGERICLLPSFMLEPYAWESLHRGMSLVLCWFFNSLPRKILWSTCLCEHKCLCEGQLACRQKMPGPKKGRIWNIVIDHYVFRLRTPKEKGGMRKFMLKGRFSAIRGWTWAMDGHADGRVQLIVCSL